MQYEGEELSQNVFYTGAAPNQQAIPAVEYLMGEDGGSAKRWFLLGTDYVYPRTTNKILRAFLKSKGVAEKDIEEVYTPFGHSDYQTIVANIKKFAAGGKTAVVSTINGDSNVPFYKELGNQGLKATDVPVVAFSVGEEELRGIDTKPLVGHLAAWNYFESVKNPVNDKFIKAYREWAKKNSVPNAATVVTNDPMEATYVGIHMWKQAVEKAKSPDVAKVRKAMSGQTFKAPCGFTLKMDETNHHLWKPVMIGEIKGDGQFNVVWKTKTTDPRPALEPLRSGQREEAEHLSRSRHEARGSRGSPPDGGLQAAGPLTGGRAQARSGLGGEDARARLLPVIYRAQRSCRTGGGSCAAEPRGATRESLLRFDMTAALRVLLAVLLLPAIWSSGSAQAADAELVKQLGSSEVSDKVRAIEALTRSADPVGLPILRALRDGNMAVTPSGQVIVLEGGIAKDAATLQPLEPAPTEYEAVVVNNRVRGQLEAAFSAFQLFSDSRDERLAAAKELESSAQASVAPILEKVLATETDPAIKTVLAQIKAGIDLKSGDPQLRMDAVKVLGESNVQRTKQLLLCRCWNRMPAARTPSPMPRCARRRSPRSRRSTGAWR